MTRKDVRLASSVNPFQRSLIEAVLKDANIPFSTYESPTPSAVLGPFNPLGYVEFRVPPDRLQEAKDVLCANGVVCDVSERLLKRCLEEVVRPLLGREGRDFTHLLHLVDVNNKETVLALFDHTLEYAGGRELLEDLFFRMARDGSGRLLILARALSGNEGPSFGARFRREAIAGESETRIALVEVLPEFGEGSWQLSVLAALLLDPAGDIREAASEALFSLRGEDCGYDPESPPAEREATVQAILEAAGFLDESQGGE